MANDVTIETLSDQKISFFAKQFNEKFQDLKKNGLTAEMFVQYFKMVIVFGVNLLMPKNVEIVSNI